MRYLSIIIILFCSRGSKGDDVTTRLMYDTMAQLVGDPVYPEEWWVRNSILIANDNIHVVGGLREMNASINYHQDL